MSWLKHWHLVLLGGLFLLAVFGPWLAPYDPSCLDFTNRFQGPSWQHPFGFDDNGCDLTPQILSGLRHSLIVASAVVSICMLLGLLIGSHAGYHQGYHDLLFMRAVDALHAFPGFLLSLGFAAFLGGSTQNLILALSVTGWTGIARLARAEVLRLKQKEFVQSAVAVGASTPRQMLVHIWPQMLGPLSVQASALMSGVLIAEASLSFLGLGPSVMNPSWGALLNAGRRFLFEAPHMALAPGLGLVLVVLSFNRLADQLRRRLPF